jgi:thiol:disulfide interchange protein DsbD
MRFTTPLLAILFVTPCLRAESHVTVSGSLDSSALEPGHPARLAVVLDVEPGYHAQSHTPLDEFAIKCELKLDAASGIEFGEAVYPAGKIQDYPQLGKLSIYSGRAIIIVPITVSKDAKVGPISLSGKVTMQICNDDTCFPPEDVAFSVNTTNVPVGASVESQNAELFPKGATTAPTNTQSPPATQTTR